MVTTYLGKDMYLGSKTIIYSQYSQLRLLDGITKMKVLAHNYHTNGIVLLIFSSITHHKIP